MKNESVKDASRFQNFLGMVVVVVEWMPPDIPPVDRALDDRGDLATGFA